MAEQHVVIDKKKRYDRQLRIWGEAGQAKLEEANVCLLNCGPTGAEALKNMVLGGIASFTIVDGSRVEQRDLGNNFMLDASSLGQSRGSCVATLLKELNDSVTGLFVEEDPVTLIRENPAYFKDFTIVIATQLSEDLLAPLDAACRAHGVPLLVARSYGLVGYVRVSLKEHCVIEARPDNTVPDLRLLNPWPELEQYAESVDLAACDDMTHKHVPWVVLVLQALAAWRREHGGAAPATRDDKAAFRKMLDGWRRGHDEANFDEAADIAKYKLWARPELSSELRAVLSDPLADPLSASPASPARPSAAHGADGGGGQGDAGASGSGSSPGAEAAHFWVLAAGLKAFVEGEGGGLLPLEGTLPDMTSLTDLYIHLQKLYQAKAAADAAAVEKHCRWILRQLGRPDDWLDAAQVKHFCRNAAHLQVLRFRAIGEPPALAGGHAGARGTLAHELSEEGGSPAAQLYALLRACDRFAAAYQRFPGAGESDDRGDLEQDAARLKDLAAAVLQDVGCPGAAVNDDYLAEVVRFGAAELHCVGALVGGIAAQEAIKLVTAQFVPVEGALVFDGITSTTKVIPVA